LFVQDGTAALFLPGVNISNGIPFLVFGERFLYVLIHFLLRKVCFHRFFLYLLLRFSSRSWTESQL